jgi:hypothetical protein
MRSYWVVSPNVRYNEATVSEWRQASVLGHAAFMGWGPRRKQIGYRFAHKIAPGDVILIARRHRNKPEIVGFGIVSGEYKRTIKGLKTPDSFGSIRKLSPFIPVSEAPERINLLDALRHSSALARLHPKRRDPRYKAHSLVCDWMDQLLSRNNKTGSNKTTPATLAPPKIVSAQIVAPSGNNQLDYTVRSKSAVKKAKKKEALLLVEYLRWLERQGRELKAVKYGKLQCDGFESKRRNLIEAKSSTSREHIRMAVGQLLDYAFQIKSKFPNPNMAILLPKRPKPTSVDWLSQLNISIIWREKQTFLDNANGQFT